MKKLLGFILLLVLIAIAAAYFYFREEKHYSSGPPILLITIDTLRADHLGCYGYSRKISPNLDRLASEGALFENAFCVMPTTLPSHGSIFFGTWPRVHGSDSNFIPFSHSSLAYLPHLLKKEGYETAAFLSAHHLGVGLKSLPGFEEFHYPGDELTADTTLAAARKWLNEDRDSRRPFFLWIHLWDPHSPYKLHPEFMDKIHPGFDNHFKKKYTFVDPGTYTKQQLQDMIDLYDNEIAFTDFYLGKFFDDFRSHPQFNRTMIIVTSDHGETLDELYESQNYAFDHGEFLYDQQIHVPLIVILPKQQKKGVRISSTASLIDLFPTILAEAKIRSPLTAEGSSLIPRIENGTNNGADGLVFLQRRGFKYPPKPFLASSQFGIRERKFKLLLDLPEHTSVLYKNDQDGVDVTSQESRIHELLKSRLEKWLQITEGMISNGQKKEVSEEDAEKLRSLGYVQ